MVGVGEDGGSREIVKNQVSTAAGCIFWGAMADGMMVGGVVV